MDQVLYFVASPSLPFARSADHALNGAARQLSPLVARGLRIQVQNSVFRTLAELGSRGAEVLIIDARQEGGELAESTALELMRILFDEHDIAGPIGREQVWLIVDPDERGASLAFEAGRARIAGTLAVGYDDSGWREIWKRIASILGRRRDGLVAVCLAGGGIEGGFYELGVLRALQYFMPDFRIQDADITCGISAGAIVGAFLANGIGPDEIGQGLRLGSDRIDKIGRLAIFDPNLRELTERLGKSAISLIRGRSSLLQAMFRAVPSGAFAGAALRRYLESQLSKPGMVNRFAETKHKFYVGATDQDTNEHVLFGGAGWEHVPIHRAVRASAALAPFYAPERIDGRYYIDGGFTRSTNVRAAVQAGASLIILVDPLVPIVSDRPGYVASKGGVMVSTQGLKSLIHGRFDRAIHMLRAMHPHVAFHLFQPDGATMRVMAGSPMKFFFRTEIEDIAYRETIRSIRQQRFYRLQRDLARFSIVFRDPEGDMGHIKRDLLDEASEVQVA